MRDVTKLRVWHRAVDFSVMVADAFPIRLARKAPGIRRQAIRAACGVAEALSEGCGKRTEREFARYVDIAGGSASEVQGQLALGLKHKILDRAQFRRLWREAAEIRMMLSVLAKRVRERADERDRLRKLNQTPPQASGPDTESPDGLEPNAEDSA